MISASQTANLGASEVNGEYEKTATVNGHPLYTNTSNPDVFIRYHEQYFPYCLTPAYYIFVKYQIYPSAIPIYKPKYRLDSSDLQVGAWVGLASHGSGEDSTGSSTY